MGLPIEVEGSDKRNEMTAKRSEALAKGREMFAERIEGSSKTGDCDIGTLYLAAAVALTCEVSNVHVFLTSILR